jgi:hypothetical protein
LSELKGNMTHPDSEILAEFRAGLITGRQGARISAHLAACERCTGQCDELAGISVLLAAVPAPVMPDAVAQRLETVLAAEAATRASSERAVDPRSPDRASLDRASLDRSGSAPPRRDSQHRHRDFRLVALRVLAPAAVVLLAAGGYGLSRIVGGSPGTQASASSASARSAVVRPTASGLPAEGSASRSGNLPAVAAPANFGVVASQNDYQRGTLQRQLTGELARHSASALSAPQLMPGSVKECVLLVTKGIRPGTLRLVETAYFQGQPANVIVAVSGHRDAVWVTTPVCSDASHYVLDTTTLPGTTAP